MESFSLLFQILNLTYSEVCRKILERWKVVKCTVSERKVGKHWPTYKRLHTESDLRVRT